MLCSSRRTCFFPPSAEIKEVCTHPHVLWDWLDIVNSLGDQSQQTLVALLSDSTRKCKHLMYLHTCLKDWRETVLYIAGIEWACLTDLDLGPTKEFKQTSFTVWPSVSHQRFLHRDCKIDFSILHLPLPQHPPQPWGVWLYIEPLLAFHSLPFQVRVNAGGTTLTM